MFLFSCSCKKNFFADKVRESRWGDHIPTAWSVRALHACMLCAVSLDRVPASCLFMWFVCLCDLSVWFECVVYNITRQFLVVDIIPNN